jgi:hypothetical protein
MTFIRLFIGILGACSQGPDNHIRIQFEYDEIEIPARPNFLSLPEVQSLVANRLGVTPSRVLVSVNAGESSGTDFLAVMRQSGAADYLRQDLTGVLEYLESRIMRFLGGFRFCGTNRKIINLMKITKLFEIVENQNHASSIIPMQQLHDGALIRRGLGLSYRESLLMELIKWFSCDYFHKIPETFDCSSCELSKMEFLCVTESDACITETFGCVDCDKVLALERPTGNLTRMLDARSGRCGEFAKVFGLFARSLGYGVRLVLGIFDRTDSIFGADYDHLWNEVMVDGRWVHIDTTVPGGSYNQPDQYQRMDGLELTAVYGVSHDSVLELSHDYTGRAPAPTDKRIGKFDEIQRN